MMDMLQEIFFTCLIPLIGILCAYGMMFFRKQITNLNAEMENELFEKYSNMLLETVETCVQATNQIYVDELKVQGRFGYTEHNIAYQKTLNAVKSILTKDAQAYLEQMYGDLDFYISELIQENVRYWKEK